MSKERIIDKTEKGYSIVAIFSERDKEIKIMLDVFAELDRARSLHPVWPNDTIHATAIMLEEAGEVLRAANNLVWGHKGGTVEDVRKEVIETMAMCLRLLVETPGL